MGLRSMFGGDNLVTSKLDQAIGWARKYSLFPYPFVTACCGMEYMSVSSPHYDLDRFGAAFPRFSPRQADMLMCVGTVSQKLAPVLRRVYDQMCEPKYVVAFGVCTCTGGLHGVCAQSVGLLHHAIHGLLAGLGQHLRVLGDLPSDDVSEQRQDVLPYVASPNGAASDHSQHPCHALSSNRRCGDDNHLCTSR